VTRPGLIAYAAYLPCHRVTVPDAAPGANGGRVAAGYDEDAVTMAVTAARQAVRGAPAPTTLLFATAAPPYLDKTNATMIHSALDIGRDGLAADVIGSPRSAVAAMLAVAGSGGVAVSADVRVGLPGSGEERTGADGAAAFLWGTSDRPAAEIIGRASLSADLLDRWRVPGEPGGREWEERFGADAYLPLIDGAAARALAEAGVEHADHVAVSCANRRAAALAVRRLHAGTSPPSPQRTLGHGGVADPGLRLAAALDVAQPGQTILWLVAADGCDAIVLRTLAPIAEARRSRPIQTQLADGQTIAYITYLTWRGLLQRQRPRRPVPDRPAPPASARAEAWKFALVGSACRRCGQVHLPPRRVCVHCGSIDEMDRRPLADCRGEVTACTVDRLAFSPSPPAIDALVAFDGGGRYGLQVTDAAPEEVTPGIRVTPTFRRLYTVDGIHNYFWKVKPG
jgi:3-hydroxy-3-methylglutaryl CoA synthase